jgi:hypothetical protein
VKFTVRIIEQPVHRDVVVEADDFDAAAGLGVYLAGVTEARVGFVRKAEDARLGTYTCWACLAQTEKHLWGPGRVTCPACNRMALSAAEYAASKEGLYCMCQSSFSLPPGEHASSCGGKLPVLP